MILVHFSHKIFLSSHLDISYYDSQCEWHAYHHSSMQYDMKHTHTGKPDHLQLITHWHKHTTLYA